MIVFITHTRIIETKYLDILKYLNYTRKQLERFPLLYRQKRCSPSTTRCSLIIRSVHEIYFSHECNSNQNSLGSFPFLQAQNDCNCRLKFLLLPPQISSSQFHLVATTPRSAECSSMQKGHKRDKYIFS